MTDKKILFGMIETFSPYPEIEDCVDEKCGRPIKFMEKCFIDQQTGDLYCVNCGVCIRYERKKAEQREKLGLPEIKINGE